MKGYKGMNNDMTCRDFKFEIGKTYHAEGDIRLCKNGFHFCKDLVHVFNYYPVGRYFEIEALGDIIFGDKKNVTNVIKIIRELPSIDINRCRYGDGFGYGDGYEIGGNRGNGYGEGSGYGDGYGNGYGEGSGYGDGYGDGSGYGYIYGDGYSNYGDGSGCGDGCEDGCGNRYVGGYDGYENFQKVAMYINI